MDSLKKPLILIILLFVALSGIFFYQVIKFNDGKLHVVFCNVGQGDGTYIRTAKGLDVVVDGGPSSSILSCLSNHMPFWDRDIEVMILSHPHEDHYLGLIDVVKRYSVLSFYSEKGESSTASYKELQKVLADKGIKVQTLSKGKSFIFKDKTSIKVLWPPNYPLSYFKNENLDKNGLSLVELLSFGKTNLLLTGDSNLEVVDRLSLDNIDILEIPHHGSKNNINNEVLKELRPKLVVISVGKDNRYGHPNPEVVKMLKDLGIKTLRTDLNGEIELVSDGSSWKMD